VSAAIMPFPTASAAARVDEARVAVALVDTPGEAKLALLKAEALAKLLESAVSAGGVHLSELLREAQALTVEAALTLGAMAASPASEARAQRAHSIRKLAVDLAVPRSTLRGFVKLVLARREHERTFDRLVRVALDERKPIPWSKLRALAPTTTTRRKKADAKTGQVKVSLEPRDLAALDEERGTQDRGAWVRDLVVDAIGHPHDESAALLLERAATLLRRVDTAAARRAVERVDAALKAVAT